EIDYFLKTGEKLPAPTVIQRLECAKEHLKALWEYKGNRGIYQARKHMAWYAKGFEGAAELRQKFNQVENVDDGEKLINQAIENLIGNW
ncbi:MAG: tRNA-dihydrouridine synthase, partial [Cyanobacteria bacterium J06629_18]